MRIVSIITALVVFLASAPAIAQENTKPAPSKNEVVVWQVAGNGAADFRQALKVALADDASNHLTSASDIEARLGKGSADPLACLKGVAPCLSPRSLALQAVGASTMIKVDLSGSGATYELIDPQGKILRSARVDGANARDKAFGVVRELFDATATVAFETAPEGATVKVGDSVIGTTPLSHRLPVGTYEYSISLPDYRDVRAEVTVGSGQQPVVRHDLELLAGMLVVTDAPAGAEVFLNDEKVGTAEAPLEVEPGTYSLEVRAAGYETMRDAVTVTPGGTVTRGASLRQETIFDLELTEEQILVNNYMLRVGYEAGFQSTSLLDARSDATLPVEFIGFTENGSLPNDGILRQGLTSNNLRLDISYAFRNFGIVLASLTYGAGSVDLDGLLEERDGTRVSARLTSFRRLSLRPFQLFWRLIYDNWVPTLEVGTGFVFNWFDVERDDTGELETLRRTDAMWTIGLGVQYYLTPNFFGAARYSLQGFFEDTIGAEHLLSFSIGVAFPNIFGFEPEPPSTLEEAEP